MAQANGNSNGNSASKHNSKRTIWAVVIVLVAVAAIGAGVYSTVGPHMPTSATAVITNTSIVEDIQTSTSTTTSLITTTAATMMTTTTSATMMTTTPSTGNSSTGTGGYVMNCIGSNLNYCQVKVTPSCQNNGCQAPCSGGNCYYNGAPYFCSSYACYYGQPYSYNPQYSPSLCQPSSSSNSTVECSGYLHQEQNGCVELAIPFLAPWLETQAYQYYTLSNLPTSYPPIGSWVTVTGLLQRGYYAGSYPYGSVCPGNTITVSLIT